METRLKFTKSVQAICENEEVRLQTTISPESMNIISDFAYSYLSETLAKDLELFSKHAKRQTIKPDDVLLCARKSDDFHSNLLSFVRTFETAEKQKPARKKSPTKKQTNS